MNFQDRANKNTSRHYQVVKEHAAKALKQPVDSSSKTYLFNTSPEPHKLPYIVTTKGKQSGQVKTDTVNTTNKVVILRDSLTQELSARYYELDISHALIIANDAEIVISLDTVNLPDQDVLKKFARHVTVAAIKGTLDNYKVVKTYPLIDKLNGKFAKVIKTKELDFDHLILIVPNTTFGQNFKPLGYTFKLFRKPLTQTALNTSVKGRIKLIGEGFGSEALVYFASLNPDKEFTTAYGAVIQEGEKQSVEVDLPPDIKDGELFIRTQGLETNPLHYTIDICKQEFQAASIQEHIKCLK